MTTVPILTHWFAKSGRARLSPQSEVDDLVLETLAPLTRRAVDSPSEVVELPGIDGWGDDWGVRCQVPATRCLLV